MRTVQLEEFLPLVLLHVAGCPEELALASIREAAREFCRKTEIWQETLDPMAGTTFPDYEFEPPRETAVARLLGLSYRGQPLEAVTAAQLSRRDSAWRSRVGEPKYVVQESPRTFMLVPRPQTLAAQAITDIRVVLTPSPTSALVGAAVYEDHADDIANGALARLHAVPKTEWADGAMATYRRGLFETAIRKTKVWVARGFGSAPLRTTPYDLG